jgi:hypothetical protein
VGAVLPQNDPMTVPTVGVRGTAERTVTSPSPPARRSSRPGWRDPRLAVGVLLLCGSVLLGARVLGSADDTVAVWGTRTALVRGQTLSADDLVPVQVRFAERESADRYVAAADPLPDGASLARDVGAGELLPRDAVTQDATDQLVEVPLSVEAAGLPSSVRVGSHVDVWVSPAAGGSPAVGRRAEAVRVLSDVAVVADGSPAASTAGLGGELRPVVVGVPSAAQDDLPRVLAELGSGTVVLVRREG